MAGFSSHFNRIKRNLGKIVLGKLNGLPHYFNNSFMVRSPENGCLIDGVKVARFTFIGPYVTMGPNVKKIGGFCSVAQGAVIGGNIHPLKQLSTSALFYAKRWGHVDFTKDNEFNIKETIIEHDVWVGSNAIIMPGVTLGTGCVVAAGAVVTKNVAPFHIVAGIPAKVINTRFAPNTVKEILVSQWWDYKLGDAMAYYSRFKTREEGEEGLT